MRRYWILAVFFLSVPGFCQTSSTDSQTLQALLAKVRQLRRDLQTTTAAAQRAQILLYRLQAQEALVAHASQRLEDMRLKLTQIQDEHKHLAGDIKRDKDTLSHVEITLAERKQVQDVILPQLKTRLESVQSEEQQRQTNEMEAENQLHTEQAKLTELQDQLDRLQSILENFGRQANGNPH